MTAIRIYEPPLCCNTGVCGPELDQQLVTFTADVNALKADGVDIERANLASDPSAFAGNRAVVAFLQAAGSEGLPLVLVDGVTVLTGRYPSRDELRRYTGTPASMAEPARARTELPMSGGCCGGASSGDGCC